MSWEFEQFGKKTVALLRRKSWFDNKQPISKAPLTSCSAMFKSNIQSAGKSQARNWKEKTEIERNTHCIWGEIWHPGTQQWLYLPTYRWQWSDDLEGRDGHAFGVQSLEWGISEIWFVKGPLTRVLAPGSGNIEMMVELIDIRASGPELAQGLRNWWEVWPSFGIQGYFPPSVLMMLLNKHIINSTNERKQIYCNLVVNLSWCPNVPKTGTYLQVAWDLGLQLMTPNMARHGNRCPILTLTMQGTENIVWISTNPHWYLLPAGLDGWVWRAYELVPVPPAGGHLVQNTSEHKPTKIETEKNASKTKHTLTILYFVIWEGRQWFLSVELALIEKRIKDIYRS